VLEGGYVNPSNIMLIGPTGMEKAALGFHFAAAGKKTKENTFIICSDSTPANVIEKAKSIGIDLKEDNIRFIDCYSSTLGGKKPLESTDRITIVPGPGALNDFSLALNDAIKKSTGKKLRVLFFSLSTFVLYNPKEAIIKFLTVIGGRLKNADATTIFVVEDGVHDKQLISLLEHSMDGKYQIIEKEGKNELEIPTIGMGIPIKLGSAGISVL
jgi:KaiC/GvpD/RAD55 family RecA-like ATPase